MGWSIGYDSNWKRDVGYGVPAICDHPGCNNEIDRGLSYVCGNDPYGGDKGCGLYFCSEHQYGGDQLCERCADGREPFEPKPDTQGWIEWKLNHESWKEWRNENPAEVEKLKTKLPHSLPTWQKPEIYLQEPKTSRKMRLLYCIAASRPR